MAGSESLVAEVVLPGGEGGSVYVVQVAGEDCVVWTDVCRVVAPARSKRRTIIAAAVAHASPRMPGTLRVLDAQAWREHKVGLRERDPELVIG